MATRTPVQRSLEELGTPLHQVTFVVVDLETTGGSPADSRITEIGAVKVRGGEVLGELASLVDPGMPIPPGITALTGITHAMVSGRPPVEAILPTFLEFARGATLVAHNARFDTGFLNAGLARLDYPPLDHPVVCTASLARRLVRDEVRNCRLATLAQHFRCATQPTHRALEDARATVEVLHGLLERAGSFGVMTLEDLVDFARVRNTPLFKARRSLADGLPQAPGVYAFRSASGEVLYVGKATDLRSRVRSYFGNDDRRKVVDLLKEAAAVDHWVCPTPLEAAVREVRLIHARRPRFNRRSKHPERSVYVKLTAERFPRLSVVRQRRDDGATYVGPVGSRAVAQEVVDALHDVVPVRRCTTAIGPRTRFAACALAEMGRCLAPCDGRITPEGYAAGIAPLADGLAADGDPLPLLDPQHRRMVALAGEGRFEDAAAARDRLRALVGALVRTRLLTRAAGPDLLVASRRTTGGRHEVVAVRHGRLVASATCDGADLAATAQALASADLPLDGLGEAANAAGGAAADRSVPPDAAEEVELVCRWLDRPGVRVHRVEGVAAQPHRGGAALARLSERLASRRAAGSARATAELADKRTRRGVGEAAGYAPATARQADRRSAP